MRKSLWHVACFALALAAFAAIPPAHAADTTTVAAPLDPRLNWFRQAGFGMFIHWGIYSVPAGEWEGKTDYGEWIQLQAKIPHEKYENFATQFNPVKFNATEWVQVAKNAGMKYLVITSKHHDGFCMYDTKLTDYNIVKATPFKRDPLKELSETCKEAGIVFCVYYSIADWHHPDFPAKYGQRGGFHGNPNPNADISKYADYEMGQVRELLTNYGPMGILWFDGGGSFKDVPAETRVGLLKGEELVKMIHTLQPACLINNRLGVGEDYGTPEQKIPSSIQGKPFEVCMTLNRHWGYNKADSSWKSSETVIRNLIDIAAKGGNYLLNVGPTSEGLLPPESVKILGEVGQWMKAHGESYYGASPSPFGTFPEWGRVTAKKNKLFLHVFNWPADGKLVLAGLKSDPAKAYLSGDAAREALKTTRDGNTNTLTIQIPAKPLDPIDTVVVLEFKDTPEVE